MSLNVALIDNSEIIKKMLSHCLYHYAAEVHRFETLEDLKSQSKHLKPDIIFIDWDLKKGDEPIAISAKKEITDTPLVVIYRNGSDEKINSIVNRIKKPLDANLLRKMVVDLIPKIGRSSIHNFLKFPNQQTLESTSTQGTYESNKKSSEKTITHFDEVPNEKDTPMDLSSKMSFDLPEQVDEDLIVKGGEDQTTFKPTKPNSLEKTHKKEDSQTKNKSSFNKDNFKLDENTLNDFAPMAVKSSVEEQTRPNYKSTRNKEDFEVKDEMILKTLEEYKNTLGFEKLMEKSLKDYAKNASQKILAKDQGEILKKSLSEFKKEDDFKQLILQTLSEYIKDNSEFRSIFEKELQQFIIKELPRLSKEIIEKEIKKILEEKS